MVDWLDQLPSRLDDQIDRHVSEDGHLTMADGTQYSCLRGPFERSEFPFDTPEGRTYVLKSTYSVQSRFVPADPRGGTLEVQGQRFLVSDYEHDQENRIVLILDKHNAS